MSANQTEKRECLEVWEMALVKQRGVSLLVQREGVRLDNVETNGATPERVCQS